MWFVDSFMVWRWRGVFVSAAIVLFVVFLVGALAEWIPPWFTEQRTTESSDAQRPPAAENAVPARSVSTYTPNVDAYALYVRGRTMVGSSRAEDQLVASELFNRVIESDPHFAGGYAGASQADLAHYRQCSDSCEQHLDSALEMARKAVDVDPSFGPGHYILAEALYLRGEFDAALIAIRKAIEVEPNDALVRAAYGRILGYSGNAEEGVQLLEEASNMGSGQAELLYELGSMYRFNGQLDAVSKRFANIADACGAARRRLQPRSWRQRICKAGALWKRERRFRLCGESCRSIRSSKCCARITSRLRRPQKYIARHCVIRGYATIEFIVRECAKNGRD